MGFSTDEMRRVWLRGPLSSELGLKYPTARWGGLQLLLSLLTWYAGSPHPPLLWTYGGVAQRWACLRR